ncbi:hypothetical protein HID58_002131 [Brassica napus]|uniref:KIB1-4 beta-propeller domain-containing protein n=1 Tax=Brassica napus TaxID=3708 RepID=A0ABQ8ELD6_BRANA|nr:hypothetical protein HID58_002131 [Brassica napus]
MRFTRGLAGQRGGFDPQPSSKWETLDSLGEEEAIFLDLGITVTLANTIQGVNGNSIYFSGNHNNYCDSDLGHFWSKKDILIFNLGTQEIERPHPSIFPFIQLSNARWFKYLLIK